MKTIQNGSNPGIQSTLTRRPRHLTASQQMEMQMEDRLSSIRPGVDHRAIPRPRDPGLLGKETQTHEETVHESPILVPQRVKPIDMTFGDDQHVHGRFGGDIFKGQHRVVFVQQGRRQIFADDSAKQTGRLTHGVHRTGTAAWRAAPTPQTPPEERRRDIPTR